MLSLIVWTGLVGAPPNAPLSTGEIARAVHELGDDEFEVRERASFVLWSAGRAAEASLRGASQNADPEVRQRARTILESFSFGIYPDTPPDIARWVHRFRSGDYRSKLEALQALKDAGAIATLFAAVDSEMNAELRAEFDRRFLADVEVGIRKLLIDGKTQQAEEFLELAAVRDRGIGHFAAYLDLTGKSGERIARLAANPMRTASESALLQQLTRLESEAPALAGETNPADPAARARATACRIVAERKTGDLEAAERSRAVLQRQLSAESEFDASTLLFQMELASGRPGAALAALEQRRDAATLEILQMERRFVDALSRLGLIATEQSANAPERAIAAEGGGPSAPSRPPGTVQWVVPTAQWLHQAAGDRQEDGPDRFAAAVEAARILRRVGESNLATDVMRLVASELLSASPQHKANLIWLARHELAIGHEAAAIEHAATALDQSEAKTAFQAMFGDDADLAEVWWDSFHRLDPAEPAAARLQRVSSMLHPGVRPPDFASAIQSIEKVASEFDKFGRARYFRALGLTCLRHADYEHAVAYFAHAVQATSDAGNFIGSGDALAQLGRSAEAAEAYAVGFQHRPERHFARFLQGAMRRRSGDAERGDELMASASILPLGSLEARHQLASALWQRGEQDAAIRQWRLALRFQAAAEPATTAVQRRLAAAIQDREPAAAAALREGALATALRAPAPNESLSGLWDDAMSSRRLRCIAALRAGRLAEATEELAALDGWGPTALLAIAEANSAWFKEAGTGPGRVSVDRAIANLDRCCTMFPRNVVDRLDFVRLCVATERRLGDAERRAAESLNLDPLSSDARQLLAAIRLRRAGAG